MPKYVALENSEINIEQLALEACRYCRALIKESSTQIKANKLTKDQFKKLDFSILETLRNEINASNAQIASQSVKLHPVVANLRSRIKSCISMKKGNCEEMAAVAFNYFLIHAPQGLQVETYRLALGDHVFLVINRDPKGDANDPATWGEDCYICDPWADNHMQVYAAHEYKSKLKSYRRIHDKNTLEDVNLDFHMPMPKGQLNLDFVRNALEVYNLKIALKGKADSLQETLFLEMEDLKNKLLNETNQTRLNIYHKKIFQIQKMFTKNGMELNKILHNDNDIDATKVQLECAAVLEKINASLNIVKFNDFETDFLSQNIVHTNSL